MPPLKQILVPTDFSRNSSHAINYACDLAKQANARLHLIHVSHNDVGGKTGAVERLEQIGAMMDGRAELLTGTVKKVIAGPPAQAITDYARSHDVDLVVMGTHGRTGLAHLTMGSAAGGQSPALRLFDAKSISLPLNHLGFLDSALSTVQEFLKIGEGLVLVTGPTGSGKTTTVYSMLQSLDGDRNNLVSIEDPVEFTVPFVRQMNVDPKHGVTMAEGLKTILRWIPMSFLWVKFATPRPPV